LNPNSPLPIAENRVPAYKASTYTPGPLWVIPIPIGKPRFETMDVYSPTLSDSEAYTVSNYTYVY